MIRRNGIVVPMRRPRKNVAVSKSLPAPVGGWNSRDSIADMDEKDAVILTNFFPSTTSVNLRGGYSQWSTGYGAQVETVIAYSGSTTDKLFGIAGGAVYDATSGGAVLNYLNLPGASGDYASTPDSAALDITGDIDIIVYVAADDWTPSAIQVIAGKWTSTGDQRSYSVRVNTDGTLAFEYSPDGIAAVTTNSNAAPSVSDGGGLWLRFTLDADNGASGKTISFYTSTDAVSTAVASISWTQLGSSVTSVGTASIFVSTAEYRVGARNGGAVSNFDGKIYKALVYSGIGGTLAAYFDATSVATGTTSILASTGETYTMQGSATIEGSKSLTGLSNSRWQYINITTPGGSFIEMCNGADSVYTFDGTTWTDRSAAITGVTSSTLIGINLHQNRIWFIQNGTLKAWYLPVQSITGAAAAFDLSAFCPHGGYLMAMATWTIDAGYGVDDHAVFITSNGDVLVYRGTDPSSASTWTLVGVFYVGSPIGRRCFVKYAGDLLIITQDGVLPLSGALQSSRVNPRVAVTDKIQQATSDAITSYGANFGWNIIHYAKQNALVLNVPVNANANQQQYVMNSITGAWCNFTGWPANCFETYGEDLYFGGTNFIGKAWDTYADNGQAIPTQGLQAFNHFGSPAQLKRFTMMRPTFYATSPPAVNGQINVNYDQSPSTSTLSAAAVVGGVWDGATTLWDSALWGAGLELSRQWQGAAGVGYCGAPNIATNTNSIQLQWLATDVVLEPGAIL